jgi:hypothetical protein
MKAKQNPESLGLAGKIESSIFFFHVRNKKLRAESNRDEASSSVFMKVRELSISRTG